MKRILAGLGLGVALALAPVAAQAGDGSHVAGHKHHECQTVKRCRPAPLPKPPGGWPCAKDHSCAEHHHYPICKPPVVTPPPPDKPPVHRHKHHKPKHPRAHHHHSQSETPQTSTVASPQLPRTGSEVAPLLLGAFSMIGGGSGLLTVTRRRRTP